MRRCLDNIQMDLKGIAYGSVDWIRLTGHIYQYMTYEHGNEPSVSIKSGDFLTSWVTLKNESASWSS
jgi:hypothetical protein